jgi:hypothetical protein
MKTEAGIHLSSQHMRLAAVIAAGFVLVFVASGYAVSIAGYHWAALSRQGDALRFLHVVFTLLLLPLGLLLRGSPSYRLGNVCLLAALVGMAHFRSINAWGAHMEPEKATTADSLAKGIRVFGINFDRK